MLVTINENGFITHRTTIQMLCCKNLTSKTLLYVVLAGIYDEILMNF
jgi:hypothetical protein